jgi:hypothetical protein
MTHTLKQILDSYGMPPTKQAAVKLVLAQYGASGDAAEHKRIAALPVRELEAILTSAH